jgi:hypothetical protein
MVQHTVHAWWFDWTWVLLHNDDYFMVTAVFRWLYVFGIMMSTVALNAYNLDRLPEASEEVSALINFDRNKFDINPSTLLNLCQHAIAAGGFSTWAEVLGAKVSFGTQIGIYNFAFLIIVALQMIGKTLRVKSGALSLPTT